MSESPGPGSARRRRRASSRQGPPRSQPAEPAAPTEPTTAAAPPAAAEPAAPKHRRPRRPARDGGDGGLHELVGGGRSQLGVSGALRGRDVNRPTDEDLAEAEQDVEIVRRHWKPTP